MSMLKNRLEKRFRHLEKWATRQGVTCFRVYDRDIPEYPCIVDWYDGDLVVWIYERTRDDNEAAAQIFEADTLSQIRDAFPGTENLFLKQRGKQRGLQTQYERVSTQHYVKTVKEQGLNFEVNLSDYLDTGLFLDHRLTRKMVMAEAKEKRVLNLFAYTGAFTCYAAAGGAVSTLTLDLSNTYVEWARRNLKLNGISSAEHRVEVADCLAFLRAPGLPPGSFDLIVCDPPTFSNSSKMRDASFDLLRDYIWLVQRCLSLLSRKGVLYFSTNARQFQWEPRHFSDAIQALDISQKTIPEDFRNDKIHRCFRITK